jgi:hypothetical protein
MRVSVRMLMYRLYVRMRWWARVSDSAAHCIRSAPGAPSMSLPNLYVTMCVYLRIIVFVRITGWDMQYIHVRGHEGPCVRARARV